MLWKMLAVVLTVVQALQVQMNSVSRWEATQMGSPTSQSYSKEQWKAKSIWDMVLVDGVLYVGSGDYDENVGPVDIWAYDIQTQRWSVTGTMNDESISRFISIGDEIIAPGIDPCSDWAYGDYHTLSGGKWTTFEKLPGAVHNFDVAEFDGKLFFGLGTGDDTGSPVLMSETGFEGFVQVPFYKDGVPVLGTGAFSFTRVYDFFELKGQLYCLFRAYQDEGKKEYEFYRYANDRFEFVSTAAESSVEFLNIKQVPIGGKGTAGNACYIAGGSLYKTKDFYSFEKVELPDGGYVTDLLVEAVTPLGGDVVYVLSAAKQQDGSYINTVYAIPPEGPVMPVLEYPASCLALSFVKDGNSFYVGFGSGNKPTVDVGKVVLLTPWYK